MQQDVNKQIIKGLPRRIALMLLDCCLIVVCYWLAVMLRFDSGDAYRRVEILRAMAPMLLYVLPIYMIVFWFGGLYEIMWEYAGMRDLARLTCLSGLATGLIMLFDLIYHIAQSKYSRPQFYKARAAFPSIRLERQPFVISLAFIIL